MKNTEVRIGNYIKRKGLVIQVDEQTFWDMKNNPKEYKPIEINDMWLRERFNFNLLEDDDGYMVYEKKGVKLVGDFSLIKYVHQLQNLYYASTLEEL